MSLFISKGKSDEPPAHITTRLRTVVRGPPMVRSEGLAEIKVYTV